MLGPCQPGAPMRARLLLPCCALICLACGGLLGGGEAPPVAPAAAPTPAAAPAPAPAVGADGAPKADVPVPFSYESNSALSVGEQSREKSGQVLAPNVTVLGPEIPEGTVLAEVKTDYEYLHSSGKIDACPEGTTLQEKKRGSTLSSYCGLPNGVRHGPWIDYWSPGVVKEIGPYVAGYRQGVFTTWDQKGKVNSRYTWRDGQPVDGRVFD